MKYITTLSILICLSFNCFSQTTNILSAEDYYEMYLNASSKYVKGDTVFQTLSTYYVVINVTDLKTGISKEICTEYFNIEIAISNDHNESVIDEQNRIFKFRSDKALNAVDFFHFDTLKMKECLKNITAETLLREWEDDYMQFMNIYSGECKEYYAFILFKKGIMTRRGCLASYLSIVSKDEVEAEKLFLRKNIKQ